MASVKDCVESTLLAHIMMEVSVDAKRAGRCVVTDGEVLHMHVINEVACYCPFSDSAHSFVCRCGSR